MTRRSARPEPITVIAYESPCGRVRIERCAGEFYLFLDGQLDRVTPTCNAAEVAGLVWLETQAAALPPLPCDGAVIDALDELAQQSVDPAMQRAYGKAKQWVEAGIMAMVEQDGDGWLVPSSRAGEPAHRVAMGRCGCPGATYRGVCWALALVEGIEAARDVVVEARDARAA